MSKTKMRRWVLVLLVAIFVVCFAYSASTQTVEDLTSLLDRIQENNELIVINRTNLEFLGIPQNIGTQLRVNELEQVNLNLSQQANNILSSIGDSISVDIKAKALFITENYPSSIQLTGEAADTEEDLEQAIELMKYRMLSFLLSGDTNSFHQDFQKIFPLTLGGDISFDSSITSQISTMMLMFDETTLTAREIVNIAKGYLVFTNQINSSVNDQLDTHLLTIGDKEVIDNEIIERIFSYYEAASQGDTVFVDLFSPYINIDQQEFISQMQASTDFFLSDIKITHPNFDANANIEFRSKVILRDITDESVGGIPLIKMSGLWVSEIGRPE